MQKEIAAIHYFSKHDTTTTRSHVRICHRHSDEYEIVHCCPIPYNKLMKSAWTKLLWRYHITVPELKDLQWSGHYRLLAVLLEYHVDCSIGVSRSSCASSWKWSSQCRTSQTMGSSPALHDNFSVCILQNSSKVSRQQYVFLCLPAKLNLMHTCKYLHAYNVMKSFFPTHPHVGKQGVQQGNLTKTLAPGGGNAFNRWGIIKQRIISTICPKVYGELLQIWSIEY